MKFFNKLLSSADLSTVVTLLNEPCWQFGFVSNDPAKPIWNFDKTKSKPIADIIAKHFTDFNLVDYHINGQTPGLEADVHIDADYGNATHAFVFFPHAWEYPWGGRLHIFNNGSTPMIVTPDENFGVLFDASLPHYAEAPVVKNLRVSIGLKFKEK